MTKKDKLKAKQFSYIPASRWKGMKGKLWRVTADYVRIRDFVKYGKCISCGKSLNEWYQSHAGHFVSVGSSTLLLTFHLDNIHAQCPKCNLEASFDMGKPFHDEINKRLKGKRAEALRTLKHKPVKYKNKDYIEMIEERIKLLKELEKEYGIKPKYLK